jgi:TP901 family phage tail tape measure protein
MFGNAINFQINITGDANNVINAVNNSFAKINSTLTKFDNNLQKVTQKLFAFQTFTNILEGISSAFNNLAQPGIDFNHSLLEMSAITGETGEGLKKIEKYARESAKTFGITATQSVDSYKLILSKLSPEIAKVPEALKGMGDNIAMMSKLMGGDAVASAETLTTAMNQYQVSLEDPMQASKEMARMMNIMAAAAKVGSAELPQIQQALENSGMAAKYAGVSFAETNAAIQVLDKAGKKGSEGGVALRNVMSVLGKGRFLPDDVIDELKKAKVNIGTLTDKSLSMTDRLKVLKPIMKDTALLTKLFGLENKDAATALISGVELIDEYNDAIQGTNTAEEQAQLIMESYKEKLKRIQATFDDIKISIFNTTGSAGLWLQVLTSSLVPIAQIMPALAGMGTLFKWIKAIQFANMFNSLKHSIIGARIQLAFMNKDLATGQMQSLGFSRNILRATLALWKFGTTGIFNAIKGIGTFILSLITGGATSASFSAIASASFATFATTASGACKAISVAIYNIPLVGWIALAVAAIGALFIYLYQKVDKFRAIMNGIGAAIKALFKGESVGDAYNNAYLKTLDKAAKDRAEEADKEEAEKQGMSVEDYRRIKLEAKKTGLTINDYLASNPNARYNLGMAQINDNGVPNIVDTKTEAAVTGGTRNTSININLGKMVENVIFNGSASETGKEQLEVFAENLRRVLYMSASVSM